MKNENNEVGRWVSVAESMPDDCMDCLVWSRDVDDATMAYHDTDRQKLHGSGWVEIGTGATIHGVTHYCVDIRPPDLLVQVTKCNRVESGN
jgi:hypothetical protein